MCIYIPEGATCFCHFIRFPFPYLLNVHTHILWKYGYIYVDMKLWTSGLVFLDQIIFYVEA